jgi:glutamyl-tRNA synthetase
LPAEDNVEEVIYKHALKNAIEYGKANSKAVLGKVLAELPGLRKKVGEVIPLVEQTVERVNSMAQADWRREIERFKFKKKEEKRKGLPGLAETERVVLRFAPNPSGPLHLGHSRAAILNDEYARRYNGTLILRFEDTDPARVDPDAYDMIREDLEWLGVKIHKTVIQSDRLDVYYNYARKLIEIGGAYVCTCPPREFQKIRVAKKSCNCRQNNVEENLDRYDKMFNVYREGDAVVRIKTSLELPDPSMRDFPIMRISDHPHPRARSYRVFPLMNFSVTIDDHLDGLTHVLRGKDHIANTEKQKFIYRYFNWEPPEFIHYGRLKIEGLALSTSQIRKGIAEGKYAGWDDVRLGTLRALKRRGIKPQAIRKAMIDVGVKKADISFSWENLYAYNKGEIEEKANRYFFVDSPKELIIHKCKGKSVSAPLHPDFPERGCRTLSIGSDGEICRVLISSSDYEILQEGEFVRLMEAFNISVLEKNLKVISKFESEPLEDARERKARLIQWVPKEDNVNVRVISPSGIVRGVGEKELLNVEVDEIVQFERFGFVRIDEKNAEIIAYFAHK